LPFEGDVKVDDFVLQNVGQRLGVGNDALNQGLVVVQLHVADDWTQGVGEQLDDLLGGVFLVRDEDVVAFPLLSAAQNQPLRASVSDSDGVDSRVFVLCAHHTYHSFCVRDSSVSQ